jgi:hypothetical protein
MALPQSWCNLAGGARGETGARSSSHPHGHKSDARVSFVMTSRVVLLYRARIIRCTNAKRALGRVR